MFALGKGAFLNNRRGPIRILRVCGSISQNVVAQQGLFTVHPITEKVGDTVIIKSLEEYLPSDPPILKGIIYESAIKVSDFRNFPVSDAFTYLTSGE